MAHVSTLCIQTGSVLGPYSEWEMLQGRFHRKNIIGKMGVTQVELCSPKTHCSPHPHTCAWDLFGSAVVQLDGQAEVIRWP